MLRETVASLIDKHASSAAVRAAMESPRGYDESLWSMLCEQVGVAALVVPEEFGGAGGELADAAAVLEELGRALVPTPCSGRRWPSWRCSPPTSRIPIPSSSWPPGRRSARSSSIATTSSTVTSPMW